MTQVIGFRLFVEPIIEGEKTTESGIIIAETISNANRVKRGTIKAVGIEIKDYIAKHKGKPIKEGDIALYANVDYPQTVDNNVTLDIIDYNSFIGVV